MPSVRFQRKQVVVSGDPLPEGPGAFTGFCGLPVIDAGNIAFVADRSSAGRLSTSTMVARAPSSSIATCRFQTAFAASSDLANLSLDEHDLTFLGCVSRFSDEGRIEETHPSSK